MPLQRKPIPTSVEGKILYLADHTCSICTTRYKDVQIHHIDEDPANNDPANLIVVCLDCHSRITGRRGLGKGYTVGEVRSYKRSWEARVRVSRGAYKSISAPRQKQLITQIDLIVCEILACEKNVARADELLDLLYELNLWRGSRQLTTSIVEGLHHLAIMTGLGSSRLSGKVAETLWKVCWHFVGPDRVSMNRTDLALVLDCVDALGTLAEFNCMMGHGQKAATTIAEQLENFFNVGVWYGQRRIVRAVTNACEEALHECYAQDRIDFMPGFKSLRQSMRKMCRALLKEQPGWQQESNRLERLLQPEGKKLTRAKTVQVRN
jgi:hypothetical protein